MIKHTPGPWVTEDTKWGEILVKSANEADLLEWPIEYVIADKVGGHVRGEDYTDYSEVMANARLIAAAPDLLEALEDVCAELKKYENQPHPEGCDGARGYLVKLMHARFAIAKARGEA